MTYKRISPQPIVEGGTNASTMTNANGVNYYDGTRIVTTTVGSAGQVLTSNGVGVAPTFQASGSSGITTINGDISSVTGSTVTFTAVNSAGASVYFQGSGTTMTLNTTDGLGSVYIGSSAGNATTSGTNNVGLGESSLSGVTSGSNNMGIGFNSLKILSTGGNNVSIGSSSLAALDTGSFNVVIGSSSGSAYTTSEDSNILIGYNIAGTAAETNTLRIGVASGTGDGQLQASYIQGIAGVSVSNTEMVTINTVTGQMGSQAVPGGGGALVLIQTLTATGSTALNFTTGITPTYNNYLLQCANVTSASTTANSTLLLRLSVDGGATYDATNYLLDATNPVTGMILAASSTGNDWSGVSAVASISVPINNMTSGSGFVVDLINFYLFDTVSWAGAQTIGGGVHFTTVNQVINAVRVVMSDGAAFTGVFSLYGYAQ